MKFQRCFFPIIGLFVLFMLSCVNESEGLQSGLDGTFSISQINVSAEAVHVDGVSRAASDGAPVGEALKPDHYKNGFKMDVSTHGEIIYSWDSYDALYNPEDKDKVYELRAGTYKASVALGDVNVEGFGEPSFSGVSSFTIVNGENTEVDVLCNLSNAKIRVDYTETFKSYFSSYSSAVTTSLENTFEFSKETVDYVYVKPGQVSVSLKARKTGGAEANYAIGQYELEGRHEYILTLDVDASTKQMSVHFSENVAEEDLLLDVSDDALNAKAPVMKAKGFENGTLVELVEGASLDAEYQVHINAEANVKSLMLKTESESPADTQWNREVDLMQVDGQQIQDLGLKLYGLSDATSQMSMVDFTGLLQNVPKDLAVKISFSVVDRFNKKSENEMSVNVVSTDAQFSISMPQQHVGFMDNKCKVNVSFKKGNLSNIKFTVAETTHALHITEVESLGTSEGLEHYTLSLEGDKDLQLVETFRLNAKYLAYDLTSEPCEVGYGILLDDEGDAWARKVVLHVYNDDMANLTVQQLAGEQWTEVESEVVGTDLVVKNLTPDATHSLRVVKSEAPVPSNIVVVKTEAEMQVPNAGMDDWYDTKPAGVNYWEVWYACKQGEEPVWNTLNELTTSEGGTSTVFGRNAFRYNANSGTIRTEGLNGNAALIRAVGWGAGNSAVGSANAKYGTVGELYLGRYDKASKAAVYSGIVFSSRPSQLQFDYKYAPGKGGDSYLAEVVIMNENGGVMTEIGKGTLRDSNTQTEWTKVSVPVVYSNQQLKATHICIKFKSGDKFQNDSFVIVPPFGNLSNGEYVGSQLYIDNINLIYE